MKNPIPLLKNPYAPRVSMGLFLSISLLPEWVGLSNTARVLDACGVRSIGLAACCGRSAPLAAEYCGRSTPLAAAYCGRSASPFSAYCVRSSSGDRES